MKEIIQLRLDDLVSFQGRLFRVCLRAFHDKKRGGGQRVILKLLTPEELNKLVLEKHGIE